MKNMRFSNILFEKYKLYIIIPSICLCFWAFLAIFKDGFFIDPIDYSAYYYAGKYIFTSPDLVYNIAHPSFYYYLPNIASIFSILSIFEIHISAWIYYFLLIFIGLLFVVEMNKILKI